MPKNIASIQELIVDAPLYRKYLIPGTNSSVLEQLKHCTLPIKAYCTKCKSIQTFLTDAGYLVRHPMNAGPAPSERYQPRFVDGEVFSLLFRCTHEKTHVIVAYFRIDRDWLIKIGQYPSLDDIQSTIVDQYDSVLDEIHLDELKKANRCYLISYAVAAFIYLRRVFEFLVHEACLRKYTASAVPDGFDRLPMEKKISDLKDYLPKLLVDNASVYSIMSEGIHNLSEEKCADAYPAIYSGIYLILKAEIERREKERDEAEFHKSLKSLSGK